MIHIDFGPDPLKTDACVGGGTALSLVVVYDQDALGCPSPVDGPVTEPTLDLSRFFVVGDLEGTGLAARKRWPSGRYGKAEFC